MLQCTAKRRLVTYKNHGQSLIFCLYKRQLAMQGL